MGKLNERIFRILKRSAGSHKNELPIVALESTIISHGMPYPQNIEMAERCEDIVRENRAVPATIAIMDGKIKIGLSKEDLKTLATAKMWLKCRDAILQQLSLKEK